MKRHFQTVGVRNWAGDDLVELQSEPLAALDAFFSEYGPCVLQGCEITESADGAGTFDIAPGLVVLEADNQADGTHRAMVMPFPGAAGVALPLYLIPAVETLTDVYADGKSKPVAYAYTAQAAGVDPGEAVPHLTLTAEGGSRFVDAVQDAGHRFISDDERAKWNRILDQAKAYADSVAEVGSEAALRNAKEYTDAREVTILAAADTKDESTLRTAKEYADRIVAALAGSAPELMDTLGELAAALGNDPNFSATVMQMISERVTTEAMEEALAGAILGKGMDAELDTRDVGTGFQYYKEESGLLGPFLSFGHSGYIVQITDGYTDWQNENQKIKFRVRNGDNNTWSNWFSFWHSGNFNPNQVLKADGWYAVAKLNEDQMAQIGNQVAVISYNGMGGLLVSFSAQASPAPLQFFLDDYSDNASLKWRHGVDASRFSNPNFRTIWDSGNLKPTYYAQIGPQGNIVSKSANWIHSVTWRSDGYGVQCYIVPKLPVNLSTAHVTKVHAQGNTFHGEAPVVFDELSDGAICVAIPNQDGRGDTSFFNISIQGA